MSRSQYSHLEFHGAASRPEPPGRVNRPGVPLHPVERQTGQSTSVASKLDFKLSVYWLGLQGCGSVCVEGIMNSTEAARGPSFRLRRVLSKAIRLTEIRTKARRRPQRLASCAGPGGN